MVALLIGCRAAAAEPIGVITILDGDASFIRGLSKYSVAEGVRVMGDDLFETGRNGFLRVEFADGSIADLGPATRVQLNRPAQRRFERPSLYLMSGWLKVGAGKILRGAKGAVGSARFDALDLAGETVIQVDEQSGAIFAEAGALRVMDRRTRLPAGIALKSGDFLALRGHETPHAEDRPSREFVAALPRAFQDTLPSRSGQFRERVVAPKASGAFTYAEVEPWLDAEPVIRHRFVREWAALAEQGAFRERLDAGLVHHPEWERILHPERFEEDRSKAHR